MGSLQVEFGHGLWIDLNSLREIKTGVKLELGSTHVHWRLLGCCFERERELISSLAEEEGHIKQRLLRLIHELVNLLKFCCWLLLLTYVVRMLFQILVALGWLL